MSIFSIFTPLILFFTNIFKTVKQEYLNLEPIAKSWIDSAIKFGNELKAYIANPGAAGPVWGEFIAVAEGVLGTGVTSAINGVIGQVVVDLGLAEAFITDPATAGQMILNYLGTLSGNKFADELFNVVKYIASALIGFDLPRNLANVIIQFVYDTFFSAKALASAPAVIAIDPGTNNASNTAVEPVVTDSDNTTSGPDNNGKKAGSPGLN